MASSARLRSPITRNASVKTGPPYRSYSCPSACSSRMRTPCSSSSSETTGGPGSTCCDGAPSGTVMIGSVCESLMAGMEGTIGSPLLRSNRAPKQDHEYREQEAVQRQDGDYAVVAQEQLTQDVRYRA